MVTHLPRSICEAETPFLDVLQVLPSANELSLFGDRQAHPQLPVDLLEDFRSDLGACLSLYACHACVTCEYNGSLRHQPLCIFRTHSSAHCVSWCQTLNERHTTTVTSVERQHPIKVRGECVNAVVLVASFRQERARVFRVDVRVLALNARRPFLHTARGTNGLIVCHQRPEELRHAPVDGLRLRQLRRSRSADSARLRVERKSFDNPCTTLVTIRHTICKIAVTVSSMSMGVCAKALPVTVATIHFFRLQRRTSASSVNGSSSVKQLRGRFRWDHLLQNLAPIGSMRCTALKPSPRRACPHNNRSISSLGRGLRQTRVSIGRLHTCVPEGAPASRSLGPQRS